MERPWPGGAVWPDKSKQSSLTMLDGPLCTFAKQLARSEAVLGAPLQVQGIRIFRFVQEMGVWDTCRTLWAYMQRLQQSCAAARIYTTRIDNSKDLLWQAKCRQGIYCLVSRSMEVLIIRRSQNSGHAFWVGWPCGTLNCQSCPQ